ncbi:MAG TPA: folylpolyglutamate synthase/dihydrofolate synthase family protein [Candidatus Binatia bacterium]|nr:folylpolyglutamate synthase/dihydrofolate synthase family protein [Candidatus Binatia bacterium]
MTYREAVARLLALRGGELPGMRPGLERIQALLDALGNPERAFRIAQVAGTNGKGSVSATLASIAAASGLRTGLYTSPHLCSFRERIRVDGVCIAEDDVVDGVETIGTAVVRLDATVFEATTALALDHFAQQGVELAVLEVGLGGRLDATTVGQPEVQVVARIDRDHEAYLGRTLAEIAREKAAIIRRGTAVTARQDPEVAEVVRARAAEVGVPLLEEGRDLAVAVEDSSLAGHHLRLAGPGWSLAGLACPLLGVFQPSNALLAVAAARVLGAGEHAIRAGLASVRWPGRFQVVPGSPTWVLDGAHNPAGARALAGSLAHHFPGSRVDLVIGVAADKDARGILEPLLPLAARVILTAASHPRAAAPAALRALLAADDPRIETSPSVATALARVTRSPRAAIACVAGSLFVIGEALAHRAGTADVLCQAEWRALASGA